MNGERSIQALTPPPPRKNTIKYYKGSPYNYIQSNLKIYNNTGENLVHESLSWTYSRVWFTNESFKLVL